VGQFPVHARLPLERARILDALGQELIATSPASVVSAWCVDRHGSLADALKVADGERHRLRQRMIFEQEELDWEVYRLYGLIDAD
ncbi:hypothetical protein C6A85_32345, partial [Mycobacterium sp. ITM-2017-0098]